MNKSDLKTVTDELRRDISYQGVDITPLMGCVLSDYPKGQIIRKEVIVMHLRWQCLFLNGNIDEEQLSDELYNLKRKGVIMV